MLSGDLSLESRVVEAHHRLIKSMIALRQTLNNDEEFVTFKTIVGNRSVFRHQWGEKRLDFKRDQAVRFQRQDELADSITPEHLVDFDEVAVGDSANPRYLTP